MRSGREHWAKRVVLEVRRGPLAVDGREEEEKEKSASIKLTTLTWEKHYI